MKTLILGGYGNFGARITRALAPDEAISLLVGGRDARRAQALAQEVGHDTTGVSIDAESPDLPQTLRRLGVQLVIHTAGPFQAQAYRVAAAAATAGAHYIDLSDGRRFVCDFPQAMHPAFVAANRTAITGASTVPALSSAVVHSLTLGWQGIDTIDICIAPAQNAPRGVATLAGVLSYCGEPIPVWVDGQWRTQPGWSRPERVTFLRMKHRLGALCDIPDLELFPTHFGVRQRVMFRAALEVSLTQRIFAALAQLRRWRLLPRPASLATPIHAVAGALDFLGSALGGMVVRVSGAGPDGMPVAREWHIAADNNHGPEIPCMATILLARRLARGDVFATGAYTSTKQLNLTEFEPEFQRWGMQTDVVDIECARSNAATA